MKLHLIGVGKMGLPMGKHLLAGGHSVTVEDLNEDRLKVAVSLGMTVAHGSTGLPAAKVVLSSLPHDAALWEVAQEICRYAQAGTIYMDTSTVSPEMSARVATLFKENSIVYLRSTVSGNNMMADAGKLTMLVSGPKDAYESVLPLLKLFGPNQFWLGEGEQARLMKLVVNLMIAQTSAMLAESLTLGTKGGLRWEDMWEVLTNSAVASPILKAKSEQLVRRDFTPTFTVTQMSKDIKLILKESERLEVALPQVALTLQSLQSAAANGDAEADYAAIIRCTERAAGLP